MDAARPHSSTHHHPPDHSHLDPQGQVRLIKSENASAGNVVDHSSKRGKGGTAPRGAPPTDVPTSKLNSVPSSLEMAAPGQAPSSSINQRDPSTHPNVGLLKAQSPWLRKDGVCIAVLEDKSVSRLIIIIIILNLGTPP